MSRSAPLIVAASIVAGCASPPASSKAATPDTATAVQPVVIPHSETFRLQSQIVPQEFQIFVALPSNPQPGTTYPVIYALDANGEFGTITETVRLAGFGAPEIPPAVVVGIGYPVDGMEQTLNLRTRDYTPTNDTAFAAFAASLWGDGEAPAPGGAPAFLRFIKDELKPLIEQRYPVDPADATLIGHSFGGLFATYALFHEPGTFQRFVIASPSLWWDHQVSLQYEKEYAAAHQDLAASVFVSVGGLETAAELEKAIPSFPEPMKSAALDYYERNGWPEMVGLIEPFGRTLAGRKYPSLRLATHVFPEETHSSVMSMIASRGLRQVFKQAPRQ
ncbi:MAG: alpha/beta hydrolase-fold protein [Gemmatimonadales bacterium]